MADLHELLAGADLVRFPAVPDPRLHGRAERLRLHFGEEAFDDPELYVRREERGADLGERDPHVLLVELRKPCEAVLCLAKSLG